LFFEKKIAKVITKELLLKLKLVLQGNKIALKKLNKDKDEQAFSKIICHCVLHAFII
jgi:hypothetical protein